VLAVPVSEEVPLTEIDVSVADGDVVDGAVGELDESDGEDEEHEMVNPRRINRRQRNFISLLLKSQRVELSNDWWRIRGLYPNRISNVSPSRRARIFQK